MELQQYERELIRIQRLKGYGGKTWLAKELKVTKSTITAALKGGNQKVLDRITTRLNRMERNIASKQEAECESA